LCIELAIEADKQGSKDMVEDSDGVFIEFPIKKIQGIPNQHSGEEQDGVKTDKNLIWVDPEFLICGHTSHFLSSCGKLSRCCPSRIPGCFAILYVGAPVVLMMGLREISTLCILGTPYSVILKKSIQ
jgi:hypothetical protein